MYIFFEKGARGGISYIFNRYSKATNKYLKSYDPKQESKHISSNINEVIRSVLNFLLFFFLIRFHKYKKAQNIIIKTI